MFNVFILVKKAISCNSPSKYILISIIATKIAASWGTYLDKIDKELLYYGLDRQLHKKSAY